MPALGSGHRRGRSDGVGVVAELEALGLAEVVAVDLVGERRRRARRRGGRGRSCSSSAGCRLDAAAAQRADRATRRIGRGAHRAERDRRPGRGRASPPGDRSSGRLPRYVYGLVLRHDREVAVVDHARRRRGAPEVRVGCGRSAGARWSNAGVDEQRVAEPALQRAPAARPASTTAASKPMPCGSRSSGRSPSPSPTGRMSRGVDAVEQVARRPRPGRWAARCVRAKTLVEPPGSDAERGVGAGQPVGGLVQGAVAAEARSTTSTPRRAASWAKRVAWPRRLVSTSSTSWSAARRLLDDDRVAGRHRRRRTSSRPAGSARRATRTGGRGLADDAGGLEATADSSVTMARHERRRLREADP